MASRYEIWLSTQDGVRIRNIPRFFFMNYSRMTNKKASCQLGLPFEDIGDIYEVDQHLEIWRAPSEASAMRLDALFFLRSKKIYQRQEDNAIVYELRGTSPIDLLNRRVVPRGESEGTQAKITAEFADDGMKRMVRENLGASATDSNRNLELTGQFSIQADVSAGPTVDYTLIDRNILDVFNEIHQLTLQLDSPIYFDIVPADPQNFQFQTFATLRGADRRDTSLVFAVENGNMASPFVETSNFEERNFIYAKAKNTERRGRGDRKRRRKSKWNRSEKSWRGGKRRANDDELDDVIAEELDKHKPVERLNAKLLNMPGGRGQPRSLYGLDWDLGDQVRASFAGVQYEPIINVVYVTVREDGTEDVNGRTLISGAPSSGLSA